MKAGVNQRPAQPSPEAIPSHSDFGKGEIAPAAENQNGAMRTDTLESALETATCLWEAVLTLRDHPATDPDAIALALAIRETCNAVGTADLRLTVVGWTGAVETAWSAVADGYDLCFDWDFVPGWIIEHIDWSDPAHPTIRPEPLRQHTDSAANAGPVAALPPSLRPPADEGN
ncbi:hypothetical protein [Novosphingobium soli]|uniref:DUF551 domain-containing protein n=1 Tax=Novosphingobium soli TaxID=574956 RepID=A0ABV6CRH3_9SPHN